MSHSSNESALLESAKRFARTRVAQSAVTRERERTFDQDLIRAASEVGLLGIEVPQEHGGLGLPFGAKVRAIEALAAIDFGFAFSLVNSQNVAAKLWRYAPAIAARYSDAILAGDRLGCTALTEPGAGSDFAAIETRAERMPGGWQLNGEKAWIVNAAVADVAVVYAQTEAGSGAAGIAAFVVDGTRAGFVRHAPFNLAGQHPIGAGGFRLEGYEASEDDLLIAPGLAFKSALSDINGARTYVAAMCRAMVNEAIAIVADYGRSRETFGRFLNRHQGWRWQLAEAEIDARAATGLIDRALARIEADEDAQVEAAAAKVFATRMAERQLPSLMHAMGAEGLREHYPLGRHLVAARVASLVDGSTEMLLERIATRFR